MRSPQQKNQGIPEWFGLGWDFNPHQWSGTGGRPEEERSQEANKVVSSALTMPWCAEASTTLPFPPLEVKDELKKETKQLKTGGDSFDENEVKTAKKKGW